MRYAILIYEQPGTGEDWTDEQRHAVTGEYMALRQRPGFVDGGRLQPVESATTVRIENGEALVTDGPFANTKEHFAGYYLFDLDDLDDALEIAKAIPAARFGGSIEVRPLVDLSSYR